MIKVVWLTDAGERIEGSETLIDRWQETDDGYLWVDIHADDPQHEAEVLGSLGCHPLAIEDAQRQRHPPKTETFDNQAMILYRGITDFDNELGLSQLPIALFVAEHCLISIHQGRAMGIERYWAQTDEQTLRQPALLALRIMHYSVGRYLQAVLAFEERINDLEDAMQERPSDDIMRALISYKSRLRKLKRTFSYHERIAASLKRETPELFTRQCPDIDHVLQDLFERSERVHSLATMYYEICGDLIEGYLSLTSHQLNNTMRVLTVITAIFVPLTFIAGIYGMNFEYIPELGFRYGYFVVMGLMGLLGVGLLALFRRLRWL